MVSSFNNRFDKNKCPKVLLRLFVVSSYGPLLLPGLGADLGVVNAQNGQCRLWHADNPLIT